MIRRTTALLVLAAAGAGPGWTGLSAAPTRAHGEVAESSPAPGAVLAAAPAEIAITLSSPATAASTIAVLDGGFQTVATGPLRLDPAAPNRIAVSVDPLPPGDYTVQWAAVDAVDGHKTQGSFVFEVLPDTPATSGTSAVPIQVWLGWVVVLIGGAAGVWLVRRKRVSDAT